MTSDPRKALIHFEILMIVSVCGLLFIAAIQRSASRCGPSRQ